EHLATPQRLEQGNRGTGEQGRDKRCPTSRTTPTTASTSSGTPTHTRSAANRHTPPTSEPSRNQASPQTSSSHPLPPTSSGSSPKGSTHSSRSTPRRGSTGSTGTTNGPPDRRRPATPTCSDTWRSCSSSQPRTHRCR